MGFDLGEILQIGSIFSDILQHRNHPGKFLLSFIDGEASMDSYLQQIDKDIVQGFKKLIEQSNEIQYIDRWTAISTTITHAYQQRKSYASIFAAAKKDANGDYVVVDNEGNTVSLLHWAMGPKDPSSGLRSGGVLEDMYSWLNKGEIRNQTMSSLYGIFENPGTGSNTSGGNNPYGHNAISLWLEILGAAQTFPGGPINNSYATNLQVNSLYKFQQNMFKLITSVYYTHELIFEFLYKTTGSYHSHNSAYPLLVNNFGNATTPGTVWYKFATALSNLGATSSTNTPTNQLQKASFNSLQIPPNPVSSITCNNNGQQNPSTFWRWCPYKFQLSDYYENAFFSSIGFVNLPPYGSDYMCWTYVGLQGTATQVGPGLTFTPMAEPVPPMSDLNSPSQWENDPNYSNMLKYIGCFGMDTYNYNYVVPGSQPSSPSTQLQVITGFELSCISNNGEFNVVVLLQFGVLDISDPQAPTVTVVDPTYYAPAWSGQMGVQEFLCSNLMGNVGGTTAQEQQTGILTNVTFDRGLGGANCFNVQLAPTAYQLDIFQPSNIQVFVNQQQATTVAVS